MKLSEKIQEALREQQEINLSDPAVQKRLAAQWGYVPAEAQPKKVHAVVCFYGLHYYVSALFFDPTSAIAWCRKEINNSTYPDSWKVVEFEIEDTLDSVQPAPSVPEGWLRAIDEALVTAHIGVANARDTYEQAKAKLDNLIGFLVDVATDPAVNGGWKLMPAVSTCEMDIAGASHCDGYLSVAAAVWDAMFAAAPEVKE